MAYSFVAGKMYRMPTHFGPIMGPRQHPEGRKFECIDNPKTLSLSVSFLGHPVNGEVERGSALSGSQIWFPVRLSI